MPIRPVALLCALVMGLAATAGCAAPDAAEPLPDPAGTVGAARSSWAETRSATLTLRTIGAVPGLDVQKLDGYVTADGGGAGEATVTTAEGTVDVEFTLSGGAVTLVDEDGVGKRISELPRVARLFGPTGSVATLLGHARALRTEGVEDLDGVATYRIGGRVAQVFAADLLPRTTSDVEVKVWVQRAGTPRVHRLWIQFPPPRAGEGATMLELGITGHDAPAPTDR